MEAAIQGGCRRRAASRIVTHRQREGTVRDWMRPKGHPRFPRLGDISSNRLTILLRLWDAFAECPSMCWPTQRSECVPASPRALPNLVDGGCA
jgi:hypothetical protein